MATSVWKSAAEREAARKLDDALGAIDGIEHLDEQALDALDELGRTCVRLLSGDSPAGPGLSELLHSVTPTTAPIVARWAGVDPDSSLEGLDTDLAVLREDTAPIRRRLSAAS